MPTSAAELACRSFMGRILNGISLYRGSRGDLRGAPDPLTDGRVEISSLVKPNSEMPYARVLRLPEGLGLSSDRRSRIASSLWPHANVPRSARLARHLAA